MDGLDGLLSANAAGMLLAAAPNSEWSLDAMKAASASIGFASGADVVEMAELSRTLVEHGLGWKYRPEVLHRLLRSATRNVVVARRGNSLAGFGIMSYGESSANLDLLAVKADCRRRGTGSQIVAWLSQVALDAGIGTVFVQVRAGNRSAIAFYQRIGFQLIDEQPGYYHGRESAIILSATTGARPAQP